MPRKPQHPRRGLAFTLVEVLAAMGIMTGIGVGVSATLMIASRALDQDGGAEAQTAEARQVVDRMVAELSDALAFTELTAMAVTATVPDRNGDGADDTIRYYWDGIAGGVLKRQFNNGVPAVVATDVHAFDVRHLTRTVAPPTPPPSCDAGT